MRLNCLNPQEVYNKYLGKIISVPCHHCSACLAARQSRWVTKLNQEALYSRYTFFVTLTFSDDYLPLWSPDEIPDDVDAVSFMHAVENSHSLIDYYGGCIPYFPREIFTKFIKRLRKYIYVEKNIKEPEKFIRYYGVSEYGPTTFRPHSHCLFFFESEWLALHFEEFITKAWSSFDVHTRKQCAFGRVDVQAVRGDAASYVASYVNSITSLPEVIQQFFKPWQAYSTCPALGQVGLNHSSLQQIINGNSVKWTITESETYKRCDVSLWRSFEDTFFPKCNGFAILSHSMRRALYTVSCQFEKSTDFVEYIRSQWSNIVCMPTLSSKSLFECKDLFSSLYVALRIGKDYAKIDDVSQGLPKTLVNSLVSLYRVSKRFRFARAKFDKSVDEYLSIIENYYARKDYENLKLQLQFEVDYTSNTYSSYKLSDLLTLIDPLFYENKNHLDRFIWSDYCRQFGIDPDKPRFTPFMETEFVNSQRAYFDNFILEGKNKKIRNEYIQLHPQILTLHSL